MTAKHSHRARAFIAPLALFPWFAFADDAPTTNLDKVVVTATRSDTTLDEMPLHTTVITARDIEASPAQTLDQLLRNVPGLLVPGAPAYTTDPTGANIKFRGMDKKVLLLLDGVPVLDPFYSTIQWFKVPLSNIARVEIVRGGGSSLWGNLAVAGVINIVSKRPVSDDGEVSISYGSMNTTNASASKDFTLMSGLTARVSVDGFRSDGYNNAPASTRDVFWPGRGDSSAKSSNVRLGVFFDPNAQWSGSLNIGYHEQNEDIGGYRYGGNLQRGLDGAASLTRFIDDTSRVTVAAYGQHIHFDKFNGAGCYVAAVFACGAPVSGNGATAAQQAGSTLQYATSYDLNTYRERGASLIYSKAWKGFFEDLQLGVDFRGISGEDAQQTYRTPTAALPAVLRVQRLNDGRGRQDFTGVFAQTKMRPLDPLEVTFSARVDRFGSSGGAADQANFSNAAVPVEAPAMIGTVPDQTKTSFDPSLSARYVVNDQVDLRGSVYRGFRAPGLNNLYRSFGSNSITIANPLLGPETMVGKELGADWKTTDLVLGATVFEADVKHVVAPAAVNARSGIPAAVQNICGADYNGTPNTLCPGTVSFYGNGQDQRSLGIELDGRWTVTRDIDLSLYATATRAYYTRATTGDPTHVQLPLVPRYVAGGSVTWRAGDRWKHFVDVRYNGAMTLSNLTVTPVVNQSGYVVADASTQYRVNDQLSIYGSITNLFDKHYTDASANSPQNISEALPRAATIALRVLF